MLASITIKPGSSRMVAPDLILILSHKSVLLIDRPIWINVGRAHLQV